MQLKFLRTTPSLAADVPFQAGQIIEVQISSLAAQRWLANGDAVLLHENETAMLGAPREMATLGLGRAKPRGRR